MTHHLLLKISAAVAGAWIALAVPAGAQPTAAQQDAIRNSCRSDFMSNCSGVPRGGAEALQCLQRNAGKLSGACRSAVDAIAPKPAAATPASPPAAAAPPRAAAPPAPAAPSAATPAAPSPAAPSAEQQAAIRQSCTSDFMANCSGVTPGGAEALQCLQRNSAKLSPSCQGAVTALSPKPATAPATAPAAVPPQPRTATPAPPPAAAPAAPAPARVATPTPAPAQPSAEQQAAIRNSCRSDFMSNCSGVTPGGAEALQCLQRNSAKLSPACKGAVGSIGGSAPATAAAPTTAAPPPPAAAAPVGNIPPRVGLMIARGCALERRTMCELPPGDGRIVSCLAANQDKLTPGCKAALAEARATVR
jgi:hypothetical protein